MELFGPFQLTIWSSIFKDLNDHVDHVFKDLNDHINHVFKDLVQVVACPLYFVFLRQQILFNLKTKLVFQNWTDASFPSFGDI